MKQVKDPKTLDLTKRFISLKWQPNEEKVQVTTTEKQAIFDSSEVTANCTNCNKETTLKQALTQHKNKRTRAYHDMNPGLSWDANEKGTLHWNKLDTDNKTYCSKECKAAHLL